MKPVIAKLKQGSLVTNPALSHQFQINNPLASQPNLEQKWTVEAWVKVASDAPNTPPNYLIFGLNNGVAVKWNSGGLPLLYLNGGLNDYYRYGSKRIDDGTYHHIAFVFDNTTTERSIYVDGILTNSASAPNLTSTPVGNLATWYIGRTAKMSMHDLRIWNYARTAQQIKDNYDKVIKPENGLVGYYKLNGDILDSSGNGNNGFNLAVGTSWSTTDVSPNIEAFKYLSTGTYGSAVFGTGENDYMNSGSRITAVNPTNFTMMAWVKTTNIAKDQIFLSNASGNYFRFSGSRAFFSMNAANQLTYSYPVTLTANKWYHFTMSYDGTMVRYYLDGVLCTTITGNANYVSFGSTILKIGRFSDGDPRSLEGGLFNIQLWNKCLTQDEINVNRFQLFDSTTPDLLSHYPLVKDGNDVKGNNGINYGVTFGKDTPYKQILVS